MKYKKLEIPDVILIEPKVFGDERGFFMETFRENDFKKNIADFTFVQDNHSKSVKGSLRGLHYQIKHPQGKLVRIISGKVFDVAVDIRKSSPFFGKWVGEILSFDNKKMLWIPPGFAHGFYVLSDEAECLYKCTDYYKLEHEQCIKWDDSYLNIDWHILSDFPPILSQKDKQGISFNKAKIFD